MCVCACTCVCVCTCAYSLFLSVSVCVCVFEQVQALRHSQVLLPAFPYSFMRYDSPKTNGLAQDVVNCAFACVVHSIFSMGCTIASCCAFLVTIMGSLVTVTPAFCLLRECFVCVSRFDGAANQTRLLQRWQLTDES